MNVKKISPNKLSKKDKNIEKKDLCPTIRFLPFDNKCVYIYMKSLFLATRSICRWRQYVGHCIPCKWKCEFDELIANLQRGIIDESILFAIMHIYQQPLECTSVERTPKYLCARIKFHYKHIILGAKNVLPINNEKAKKDWWAE